MYQSSNSDSNGGLAQLARAPALQAGGQRFESVILHTRFRIHNSEFRIETNIVHWHIVQAKQRVERKDISIFTATALMREIKLKQV